MDLPLFNNKSCLSFFFYKNSFFISTFHGTFLAPFFFRRLIHFLGFNGNPLFSILHLYFHYTHNTHNNTINFTWFKELKYKHTKVLRLRRLQFLKFLPDNNHSEIAENLWFLELKTLKYIPCFDK